MVDFLNIKALTFDCYGTLIDWETGILNILRPWALQNSIAASDGELLRAFGIAEVEMESAMPGILYPEVLRAVMNEISLYFRVLEDPKAAAVLATSVGDWPPFPDSREALHELKEKFKLVIISNVDHRSFARSNEKLGVEFDLIVTAEDAGAYKPDHRPFILALEQLEDLGVEPVEILHVAQSLFHDHVPAKELGLKTIWVDRRRGKDGWGATPAPLDAVEPDLVVTSLAELAALA